MLDLLSDMITRIKNGQSAKLKEIKLYTSTSRLAVNILKILYIEGYIRGYKCFFNQKYNNYQYIVFLKYDQNGSPIIKNIGRISKNGRRVFVKSRTMWKINSGLGILILSTKKGILTDLEARSLNLGGEVLCYVF